MKRSSIWLHFTAALLILSHAISHFYQQQSSPVYFWCQLIIALDILILVLAGRDTLTQIPRVNLFFRLVEIVFFLGIGLIMLLESKTGTAIIHISLSLVYGYLFYCERGLDSDELLSFHHTGITIPGLPESQFLLWTHINEVETRYDSIYIKTSLDKNIRLDLRRNLEFEELEQIHEFCKHYLKT